VCPNVPPPSVLCFQFRRLYPLVFFSSTTSRQERHGLRVLRPFPCSGQDGARVLLSQMTPLFLPFIRYRLSLHFPRLFRIGPPNTLGFISQHALTDPHFVLFFPKLTRWYPPFFSRRRYWHFFSAIREKLFFEFRKFCRVEFPPRFFVKVSPTLRFSSPVQLPILAVTGQLFLTPFVVWRLWVADGELFSDLNLLLRCLHGIQQRSPSLLVVFSF